MYADCRPRSNCKWKFHAELKEFKFQNNFVLFYGSALVFMVVIDLRSASCFSVFIAFLYRCCDRWLTDLYFTFHC